MILDRGISCRVILRTIYLISISQLCVFSVRAAESDTQQWSTFQLSTPVENSSWTLGLWSQVRFSDDISYFNWFLINPSVHYKVNDDIKVGAGFQYIIKNDNDDEYMPWQEVSHSFKFANRLVLGNRFRVEERISDEWSGLVFRARYRLSAAYPLKDSHYYLTGSNATWFNMNEQDEGPRKGFDQNRLFGGLGVHIGKRWRLEGGYQWRHKYNDHAPDNNDHVLMLQFFYSDKDKEKPVPVKSEAHW